MRMSIRGWMMNNWCEIVYIVIYVHLGDITMLVAYHSLQLVEDFGRTVVLFVGQILNAGYLAYTC